MRRIARIDRSIDLLRTRTATPSPSSYLCSVCKTSAPFSTSSIRTARGKVPLTEKIRRKIWGTDNPPGLQDPYGDKSVFDQSKKKEREKDTEERKAARKAREARKAAKVDMSTYEPASTWDGLDHVGDIPESTRDYEGEYEAAAFAPSQVTTDSEEITAALHRAMVEIFALQEAGVPLSNISNEPPAQDLTLDVTFADSSAGPKLQFADNAPPLEDIVQSLAPVVDETAVKINPTESEEDVAADRSDVDPLHQESESSYVDETAEKSNPTESEEDVAADRSTEDPLHQAQSVEVTYEDLIASWGQSWLQVSLENPEIKFAVMKRMMQLTGIRIPDAHLKSKTAQQLLKLLIIPPKPRKLVEALSQKEELITLPNVSIYGQRITPIDKERSVGRWKVIEQELEARGLPVTGH